MAKTAIPMVNLRQQYLSIKYEMDAAIQEVLDSAQFINGESVQRFEEEFASYLNVKYCIGVANGTDALQVSFMALGLEEGDEVITPSFTYAATAEILGLLKLTPVFVDVDPQTFTIDPRKLERSITARTKAIIPVHLYGLPSNLSEIRIICQKYGLYMIEDTAQAVRARLKMAEGKEYTAGTVGDIGTFSFFPSKNLGCYGDGGAVCTNDKRLAERIRMVARHGQRQKYVHEILGCNSRLDSLQAAVLSVKLRHLESWTEMRIAVARRYNEELGEMEQLSCPVSPAGYRHVYHQYTIRVKEGRDELQEFLKSHGVPSVVYYRIPLHRQKAFLNIPNRKGDMEATEHLVDQVLSIPMDSELDPVSQGEIINKIKLFYTK